MASAPQNFKYHSGPCLREVKRTATDSKTWVAGEAYKIVAAGTVEPCATDDTTVKGIFAADQSTATSSSEVVCYEIQDAATRFLGYVSSDGTDAAAAAANVGDVVGYHVGSNVATVNLNETSSVMIRVQDLYHVVETGKAAAADDPGRVVFSFLQAALDA